MPEGPGSSHKSLVTHVNKLEARTKSSGSGGGGASATPSNNSGGGKGQSNARNNNGKGNNGKNGSSTVPPRKCWDCDSTEHLRGDPRCPKSKFPPKPKQGEPTKIKIDDKDYWWCDKCDRWNPSHGSAQHRTKAQMKEEREKKGNQNSPSSSSNTSSSDPSQTVVGGLARTVVRPLAKISVSGQGEASPAESKPDEASPTESGPVPSLALMENAPASEYCQPVGRLSITGAFPMMGARASDSDEDDKIDGDRTENRWWFDSSDDDSVSSQGESVDEDNSKTIIWDPQVKDNELKGILNRGKYTKRKSKKPRPPKGPPPKLGKKTKSKD